MQAQNALIDKFGRKVEYLRMSVTDRCDFRCVYCMSEDPEFLRREQVLTLEEMACIGRAFSELGVSKIRLTGGEPLVRTDCSELVRQLGALPGITDLAMTTNGSRLSKLAPALKEAGLKRLNISLDTLDPERFTALTRTGKLERVLKSIDTAREQGFERIKINAVILKGQNDHEVVDLVNFCRERELDISFIEEMPLGHAAGRSEERFCSSDEVRALIEEHYPLTASVAKTAGPSRYYQMTDSPIRIGFISPHSHNFCHECNRVRLTVEGRLLLCLGNENSVDLKSVLRANPGDIEHLKQVIREAIMRKPEQHIFSHNADVQILRFMSHTGG
ncbi:GTP 3',8-cyclase MoaA [Paraferrimonas sedimenticola]|uniref:GTP 3',8-cyclase n=1 Tax=Paraferrimonas sedimenticola TaxID=375674 RepID=A0AA37RYM7_9GAMM|nr:GTP 3',8-cyclase MoaA [Paraferrimonas sedimenticola]GLP97538.1 cyclic pyranopterin monophosphate synthase [Paraferrimonas sedimenticola]